MTSGPKLRDHSQDHQPLNSPAIVESEAENAHFQPSAWGFLTTKHSQRFANDGALALREKIAAGMDFREENSLSADYGRNLSVLP